LLFEVLLISAALADRIDLVREEREQERHEKIQLIEQQKTWLEENVKLRTQELTHKTIEVERQNEELKQQHEELSVTHELLEKQQQLVEKKNKDIENINQSLELKVQQRTLELEETVKRLIKHNHDLQQFSYIVSHNLRAPVVRILGLLDLMKMEGGNEQEKELIYQYLKESALGLDQIIHDLSDIIAIRKGLETMVEPIDIASILRHNQRDLDEEIKRASAVITTSINVAEFVSVKSYIQSILYNLLSNAIKYRSHERKLIIHINAFEDNGNVVFEVKDNGMGIDLPEVRLNEIFNLYKRLHVHIPGKGLGLYLVKTQVEALNGKIEVRTIVGEGTIFKVTIPKN
jgi:signal transduction histidine kinase